MCTDVRAHKVHKRQSHRHPLGARFLTGPLLRLTSGLTLLPWHFVGANSNFLCGLLDWNRKLKVSREDSSFSHCACYLLLAVWGIHFVIITRSDQLIICSVTVSLRDEKRGFLWRPTERDSVQRRTVLLDRTNTAGKEPKECFLLCYGGAGLEEVSSWLRYSELSTLCFPLFLLSRAMLPQAFKPDFFRETRWSRLGFSLACLSAMLLLCWPGGWDLSHLSLEMPSSDCPHPHLWHQLHLGNREGNRHLSGSSDLG